MEPDELEARFRREARKYGYSYDKLVRQSRRRSRRQSGFPLDPTVLLERLLRHMLRSLERFLESLLLALERRRWGR